MIINILVHYLAKILKIINPVVIATLGICVLEALKIIKPHNYKLKTSAETCLVIKNI